MPRAGKQIVGGLFGSLISNSLSPHLSPRAEIIGVHNYAPRELCLLIFLETESSTGRAWDKDLEISQEWQCIPKKGRARIPERHLKPGLPFPQY